MRKMNKNLLGLIVLFALITGLFSFNVQAKDDSKTLIILHTNDFHGNMKPLKDKSLSRNGLVGGSAYLATMIKRARQENPGESILVSAGDIAQGTPISNIFEGLSVVEIMNALNYDAMTPGNHEFDWGQKALQNMAEQAEFPMVSSNIVYENDPEKTLPFLKPFIIKEVNSIKLGILGVTTPETKYITMPSNTKGLKFVNPATAIKKYLPVLQKENVDLILVLSHQGLNPDLKLAADVPQIDVIVGGHSHTRNYTTKTVGKTLVVQAGAKGEFLGQLKIEFDPENRKILSHTIEHEIKPVLCDELEPDPAILAIVDKYDQKISEKMGKKVAVLKEDLSRGITANHGDSPLGNMICDSMIAMTGADVAFVNPGGIRSDLYQGEVTVREMYKILPFENTVMTINMKGRDIKTILEHGAGGRTPLQVAGITMAIDYKKPKGNRVGDIKIEGIALDTEKTYKVATIDYIFTGGDGYDFSAATAPRYYSTLRSVFTNYLEEKGEVEDPETGRINMENSRGGRH
ncbi:MAG: bifunctional metallophosphatase/5'-nucleotidase [Vulcanimicrobiota bacterium]